MTSPLIEALKGYRKQREELENSISSTKQKIQSIKRTEKSIQKLIDKEAVLVPYVSVQTEDESYEDFVAKTKERIENGSLNAKAGEVTDGESSVVGEAESDTGEGVASPNRSHKLRDSKSESADSSAARETVDA